MVRSTQNNARRSAPSQTASSATSQQQQAAIASQEATTTSGTQGLADWRDRQRLIKQSRIEHGKKLQEKLKDMRSKGLLRAKKPQTLSQASGLEFPVRRVLRHMKELNPNRIVYETSGVMLAGVIEYLCAEVLELAGNTAKAFHKKRITPREIYLAVKNDVELDKLLEHATMAYSGALPNIHPSLIKTPKTMPALLEPKKLNTSRVSFSSPSQESMAERVESNQTEMSTPSLRKTKA